MIDARKTSRTLTWPADPFDAEHCMLNTTGKKLIDNMRPFKNMLGYNSENGSCMILF